jgi:arginase
VLLGGSCFNGIGVVAGLGEAQPGVVWLDAHSDFNTPDAAISGYFDGMGLAVLAGDAWQALHATVEGGRPVPQTAMVPAGARDFEPPEPIRLAAADLLQADAADLATPDALLEAIRSFEPEPTGIYLHLDLDVLDSGVAGVNVFSAPGGPDGEQLAELIAAVCRECPVRAISLTAYDPTYDPDGRVPEIAVAVLRRVAESLV